MLKFKILSLLVFGMILGTAQAQDLSDNEVCMECHADTVRENLSLHNDDGTLVQEAHQDFSCVDCHDYIVEIPHSDDVLCVDVNCFNCHDEVTVVD